MTDEEKNNTARAINELWRRLLTGRFTTSHIQSGISMAGEVELEDDMRIWGTIFPSRKINIEKWTVLNDSIGMCVSMRVTDKYRQTASLDLMSFLYVTRDGYLQRGEELPQYELDNLIDRIDNAVSYAREDFSIMTALGASFSDGARGELVILLGDGYKIGIEIGNFKRKIGHLYDETEYTVSFKHSDNYYPYYSVALSTPSLFNATVKGIKHMLKQDKAVSLFKQELLIRLPMKLREKLIMEQ